MTVAELKAALDAAGVEYSSGAKKAELQALLDGVTPADSDDAANPVVEAPNAAREPVNIPVKVQVETPDGTKHRAEYTIINAHTAIIASQINNGQALLDMAKKGLVDRFGVNYVQ